MGRGVKDNGGNACHALAGQGRHPAVDDLSVQGNGRAEIPEPYGNASFPPVALGQQDAEAYELGEPGGNGSA